MKLAAMKDDTENLVFLIGIIKKTLINSVECGRKKRSGS